MPLSRRSRERAKSGYERPDHIARRSETACFENVISNLCQVVLGFGRQNITAHPARRLCSSSSSSVRSPEEKVSPSTTSPRSDCKNARSILARASSGASEDIRVAACATMAANSSRSLTRARRKRLLRHLPPGPRPSNVFVFTGDVNTHDGLFHLTFTSSFYAEPAALGIAYAHQAKLR